jgi:isopenicillin N synthase-like dioxygenase
VFRKYYSERSTQRFSIAYFVGSDFNEKYPADGAAFRRVEAQVEDEHVSNLQYHCYRERSQRKSLIV